jgi:hypothetical protein
MKWWVKSGSINGPTWDKTNNVWAVSWVQVWENGREIKLGDEFVLHTFALRFMQQLRKRENHERESITSDGR